MSIDIIDAEPCSLKNVHEKIYFVRMLRLLETTSLPPKVEVKFSSSPDSTCEIALLVVLLLECYVDFVGREFVMLFSFNPWFENSPILCIKFVHG